MNNTITGTGRLGRDPELRYTQSGKAVVELGVALQNSTRVPKSDPPEYKYSETIWVSITLWDRMAENAAALLRKGDDVVFSGSLELEKFTRRDGDPGEKLVLKGAEVAPSIRRSPLLERNDGRGETQPRARSDNRSAARPAAQHRTPDPVGAGRGQLEDPFA